MERFRDGNPIRTTSSVVNHSTGEVIVVDVVEGLMCWWVYISKEADAKHSPRLEHQLNTELSANNTHKGMKKIDELIEYKTIWMRQRDEFTILPK